MTGTPSPITGNLAQLEQAIDHYFDLATLASRLGADLGDRSFGNSSSRAIDGLQAMWLDLADEFDDLRSISSTVVNTLAVHRRELQTLQNEGESAAAELDRRLDEVTRANGARNSAQDHLDELVAQHLVAPDESVAAGLEHEIHRAESELEVRADEADVAARAAEDQREELRRLADREDELNRQTADAVGEIKLGVLRDQSRIERLARWTGEKYIDLQFGGYISVWKMGQAIAADDWDAAFMHFRDYYNRKLFEITAAVIIASWAFPPAGATMTALWVAGAAGAGMTVAAAALELRHPDTGEVVSGWEAAIDVAFAAIPLGTAVRPAAGLRQAGIAGRVKANISAEDLRIASTARELGRRKGLEVATLELRDQTAIEVGTLVGPDVSKFVHHELTEDER